MELSEAPEKPSGALGEPHELQATEMQWGPLKCFVNRRKRHSRATSSQMYSANTFVDFPIAQTLEDRSKNFMRLRSLTGDQGSPNSVSIPRAVTKAKW